ncbi:MAG: flagellar export chaperone FlgN [bacterium]
MENLTEYKNNLKELLDIALKLNKEISESYSAMRLNVNPVENTQVFNNKRKALSELIEKLKSLSKNGSSFQNAGITGEGDEEIENLKNDIRTAVFEINKTNEAFSGLIKKNMYYNQLTISFIADAFNRSSIYGRTGENNSNFFPLKNILIGSGVRV